MPVAYSGYEAGLDRNISAVRPIQERCHQFQLRQRESLASTAAAEHGHRVSLVDETYLVCFYGSRKLHTAVTQRPQLFPRGVRTANRLERTS
jgi:ABC-type hemin transport system substrate-binding protein